MRVLCNANTNCNDTTNTPHSGLRETRAKRKEGDGLVKLEFSSIVAPRLSTANVKIDIRVGQQCQHEETGKVEVGGSGSGE